MKKIKWATNFNNKLGNTIVTHLDAAPANDIPETALPARYEIVTEDGSHEPVVYELFSIIRGTLIGFYTDAVTCPSHGMERFDFADWYLKQRPHPTNNPELAIYFFRLVCK